MWKHEASDFTNWLAESENLDLLGDEIGITISLVQTEASVGKFNVDILAEEENTGRKIVIENQLGRTDHDHLGKIITYASGFDAEIIIWIVKRVRDEHKQAVDWLNEHTDEKINIFAIQIEVWQIEDSPPAPRFHVIAKPNDWAKAIKKTSAQSELSDTKMLQFEFWAKFKEYVQDNNEEIKLKNPRGHHNISIRFGSPNATIRLSVNSISNKISCGIYIPDSPKLFSMLYKNKEKIEAELSEQLEWEESPEKKISKIKLIRDGDIHEQDSWQQYHSWMLEKVMDFQKVFGRYILKK